MLTPRVPAHLPLVPELAVELLPHPEVVTAMLKAHVDDGSGHCRGCCSPQAGRPRWPCTLHAVAAAARSAERARRLP